MPYLDPTLDRGQEPQRAIKPHYRRVTQSRLFHSVSIGYSFHFLIQMPVAVLSYSVNSQRAEFCQELSLVSIEKSCYQRQLPKRTVSGVSSQGRPSERNT